MTKVINDGFPGDNEVLLDEITCKYFQDNDCTEDRDNGEGQMLILSTRDGGGGKFINIQTKNWSISDESDLIPIFKHFRSIYGDTSDT